MIAATTIVAVLLAFANAEFFGERGGAFDRNKPDPQRFNFFDIELLQEVIHMEGNKGNVVVSPTSTKLLLGMVLEGSAGDSEQQIVEALRLPKENEDYREALVNFYRSIKVNNPGNVLETANRLFISKLTTPLSSYNDTLQYYGMDIRQVDFGNTEITATTINDWVAEKTHGFINKLVDPVQLNSDIALMLVNAVYFKGKWKLPFHPDSTIVRYFQLEDGSCQPAYFMETLNKFKYAYIKGLHAQAVEMKYEGDKFSMILLLPMENNSINQLVRDLPHKFQNLVLEALEEMDVLLSVPRFTIDYGADLVNALQGLRITDIFGAKANLTKMVTNSASVHINKILQRARITVNEEGSEAAVATGAIAIPLMGNAIPRFRPDRPFLFFIRDLTTGSILFEGRVSQPDLAYVDNISQQPIHRPGTCPNLPQNNNRPQQPNQSQNNNRPQQPNRPQSNNRPQQPNRPQSSNNPNHGQSNSHQGVNNPNSGLGINNPNSGLGRPSVDANDELKYPEGQQNTQERREQPLDDGIVISFIG